MNRLKELEQFGQSVWLDYIRRHLIVSGELQKLIDEDGLSGLTSNPAIFEKAIVASTDYVEILEKLSKRTDLTTKEMYEQLAIQDIQAVADALLPTYKKTKKRDGYVSLEVSPELARDTQGTIQEAKRLWQAVGKENLLIKVPGTPEGVIAIRELIAEGINVNVTLLFSIEAYQAAAQAYIEGLELRVQAGKPIAHIASVASFFVSRIDTLVDNRIDALIKQSAIANHELAHIKGKVAIANAKLAYQYFKQLKASPRYQALSEHGAQPQRLLWASTSAKNPLYSDVLYVESLIGPETVNTMPPNTMDAFRDHGHAAATLEQGLEEAYTIMQLLEHHGLDFKAVTAQLLEEAIKLFVEPFHQLLEAITQKKQVFAASDYVNEVQPLINYSAGALSSAIKQELKDWQKQDKVRHLWARDASLWTNSDEAKWMGWLGVAESVLSQVPQIMALANELKTAGFTHIVLLGMGGSSLCPAMMVKTFGKIDGYPCLRVLDSTDPLQIKHLEESIDLKKTFFIVSSKSGSTTEPNIFKQYFFSRLQTVLDTQEVGDRFLAITDPNTKLEGIAKDDNFKAVFHGLPSIGGRYSALSNFGMVPAALMGVDIKDFLGHAEAMRHACSAAILPEGNPGVLLGVILGVCAKQGKDKVTLIASPGIAELGAWLEQLLAESTGKNGKGLIPVDQEPLGPPNVYGSDRIFAYIRLDAAPDLEQDRAVDILEKAGHVVVRLHLTDIAHLGAELFRWEIATAVAGSVIGINVFNQPDVEASKLRTLQLTSEYENTGKISQPSPLFAGDGLQLFTDEINAHDLNQALVGSPSIESYLKAHLVRVQQGDYVDLSAFIEMSDEHTNLLQQCRTLIRDNKKVATCLGFGPRFLHSTGQAYKGGPNSGVFLQITCDHENDLQIPGRRCTFGLVIAAQAQGDFEVLAQRGRRVLRIHLGKEARSGLQQVYALLQRVLPTT